MQLDSRGSWLGDPTRRQRHRLRPAAGPARTASGGSTNPPDALIVSRTHFDTRYVRYDLTSSTRRRRCWCPSRSTSRRATRRRACWSSGLLAGPDPGLRVGRAHVLPAGTKLEALGRRSATASPRYRSATRCSRSTRPARPGDGPAGVDPAAGARHRADAGHRRRRRRGLPDGCFGRSPAGLVDATTRRVRTAATTCSHCVTASSSRSQRTTRRGRHQRVPAGPASARSASHWG